MRAGTLREVLTIETPVETRDAVGGIVQSWQSFATVRAEMVPLSGREYFAAMQTKAESTVRFRIRYLDGITPKMRVNHGGTLYDIKAAIPDSKRREILLMCET